MGSTLSRKYLDKLTTWEQSTVDRVTVDWLYNGLSWFVTIRRFDGFSATATHPTDVDEAALSAARNYKLGLRSQR